MIGHLCLTDFILFRCFKENGLEPEMGSGVCLCVGWCVGKVLGTPRHPFAKPRFVGFNYVQMS